MWNRYPTDRLLDHVRTLDEHDQIIPVDLLAELEARGVSLSKLSVPEDEDFGERVAFQFSPGEIGG